MKLNIPILILLMHVSYHTEAAVSLSNDSQGAAIVIPYYTVANNLNTLVSINNAKNQAKAIKVNIREALHGQAMFTFNLYLAANETWTFALSPDDEFLTVLTNDQSCVLNLEPLASVATKSSDWQWQNGMVEIIEMGEVLNDSSGFFASPIDANNCQKLNDAWNANGPNSLWQAESTAEMSPSTGGIHAEATVIDVAKGFAFGIPVLAFDNFFDSATIYHREPSSTLPNLSSGSQQSVLLHEGQSIETTWPTGYEAISALLMKTTLENEFDVSPEVGAINEWVVSFPTLRFHQSNTETQVPFIMEGENTFRFPGIGSSSFTFFTRSGESYSVTYACVTPPPGTYCPPVSQLTGQVNTYVVDTTNSFDNSVISTNNMLVSPISPEGAIGLPAEFNTGKIKLNINSEELNVSSPIYAVANLRGLDSSTNIQHAYHGLPVTGFAFQQYRNANAQPGLLATYATAKAHYGNQVITEE